jgi:hypothetical protein
MTGGGKEGKVVKKERYESLHWHRRQPGEKSEEKKTDRGLFFMYTHTHTARRHISIVIF